MAVAGVVGFFLLSDPVIDFLEPLGRVGFAGEGFTGVGFMGGGLEGFSLGTLGVEGLGFGGLGGFVGGSLVLSGAVTVSVLALGGGDAKPNWTVTGITVENTGIGMVPGVGFIV